MTLAAPILPLLLLLGLVGVLAGLEQRTQARPAPTPASVPTAPALELFSGSLPTFDLRLPPESRASLRAEPRRFVPARFQSAHHPAPLPVAVRVKGAVGSFRPLDDTPSLTLDFQRAAPGTTFLGLTRLHLNNSVEDPTRLHELVGALVFAESGIPAPRVGHARVQLDGRPLGLYVAKEGFTGDFLARAFPGTHGVLLEPGSGQDVDGTWSRQAGDVAEATVSLKPLAEACREPDLDHRQRRLEINLDLPRFLDFMALEVLLGHRDGYTLAGNNYRLHVEPRSGRVTFLPQGLDQLLGRPDLPWLPHAAGSVARAALGIPAIRERYRARLARHLDVWLVSGRLETMYRDQAERLLPSLARREASILRQELSALGERIRARTESLRRQLADAELPPAAVGRDPYPLSGWIIEPTDSNPGAGHGPSRAPDGTRALEVDSSRRGSSAWTTSLRLGPGRYRFSGEAWVQGFAPWNHGHRQGPGLRRAGEARLTPTRVVEGRWQPLAFEFDVRADVETVQLICDWRAREGRAWFALDSLRLSRVDAGATP